MDFDYDEISEALGEEPGFFDSAEFEENMSTHYGRMIHQDDRTIMFANPEDAADLIGFDLKASDELTAPPLRSSRDPPGGPMYEKDGHRYFVVDSHMHYWDASPRELGRRPRELRQGLDRVLPRLPVARPAGDPLADRALPEVLRGRPHEGRLRGRPRRRGDLPADLPQGVVPRPGSTRPSRTASWRSGIRASSSSTPAGTPARATPA